MTQEFKLKSSVSEMYCPVDKNSTRNRNVNDNYYQSHEVFRNDTTAVEIIVKRVKNKKVQAPNTFQETNVTKLSQEVENSRNELNKVNRNLEEAKKCFRLVLFEMGKQLEAANQRELETQTRNLVLQLEKEKLNSMLELKTNSLAKLRKELLGMRRIIKFVNKSIRCVPSSYGSVSDSDYARFVNGLKDLPSQCDQVDDNVTYTNETTLSSKI